MQISVQKQKKKRTHNVITESLVCFLLSKISFTYEKRKRRARGGAGWYRGSQLNFPFIFRLFTASEAGCCRQEAETLRGTREKESKALFDVGTHAREQAVSL